MKKTIKLNDVKHALLDERFRATLPEELQDDVAAFLKNPTCGCNNSIYLNVYKKAKQQLQEYYPNQVPALDNEIEQEKDRLLKNEWQVINCNIHELVHELRKLGPGRKQVQVARFEDQVTVIVNHLEAA